MNTSIAAHIRDHLDRNGGAGYIHPTYGLILTARAMARRGLIHLASYGLSDAMGNSVYVASLPAVPEHTAYYNPCVHSFSPQGQPITTLCLDKYGCDDHVARLLSWGRYVEVWDTDPRGNSVCRLRVGPSCPLTSAIRPRPKR